MILTFALPRRRPLSLSTASAFAALLLASITGLSAATLSLSAPLDWQVVQRDTQNRGTIRIAGEWADPSATIQSVEARLVGAGADGKWHPLTLKPGTHAFQGQLEASAGGWYRLEVRAGSAGQWVAEASLEHVGVGEVFVVAGQSNSANHGAEKQTPQSGLVTAFSGKAWQPANDPQPGASGAGGSFLPPFGDGLAQRFKVPIGLVACGVGATSVREWLPPGTRFPNPPTLTGQVVQVPDGGWESKGAIFTSFTARLKALGPRGFRTVLWHQGESDANQKDPTRTLPGKLYRQFMELLIQESRKAIGWAVPWFVAQASYHTPEDTGSPDIRDAQQVLWRAGLALEGPDTDALTGELRDQNGQGVHFSGPGLRAHALHWFEKVAPWLETQLKLTAHETRTLEGWTVRIHRDLLTSNQAACNRALELLTTQLAEIRRVLPPVRVAEMQQVILWLSPEYPGIPPRAEYHPNGRWLEEHRRNPAMAKGIEFTNIRIFEAETRRMPVFALHELAHAYHDRVLGFEEPRIRAAFDRARQSGSYDSVERRDAQGRITRARAYALTDHKEYFAETSEAFLGKNDFFPFTRAELRQHDPDMFRLLEAIWTGN